MYFLLPILTGYLSCISFLSAACLLVVTCGRIFHGGCLTLQQSCCKPLQTNLLWRTCETWCPLQSNSMFVYSCWSLWGWETEERPQKRPEGNHQRGRWCHHEKKFKQLRPAGHYVDGQMVHSSLPCKLQEKVCQRTVVRRLNEKGYYMTEKRSKDDPSEQTKKRRVAFCKPLAHKTAQNWKTFLQAVADLSEPWLDLATQLLECIFWPSFSTQCKHDTWPNPPHGDFEYKCLNINRLCSKCMCRAE